MFHTPAHKVAPHLPQAGTIENVPFLNHPGVITDPVVDVEIADHGTVVILTPLTERASKWCEQFIGRAMRWAGGYAIEHRYVDGIVGNMLFDGLEV